MPRRILAVLALEQRSVSRDELGDAVWDGEPPPSWEVALRGGISQIRRAIQDAGGSDPIRTAFGAYELSPDVRVDLARAARSVPLAEAALRDGEIETALARSREGMGPLTTPLLPGEYGPWFDHRRRTFEGLAVRLLLVHSAASTAVGDHVAAVDAAERASAMDQFLEAGHQRLMAAHAAAGNRAEALLAYRRCREVLAEELGVDPSKATEAVYLDILEVDGDQRPVAPVVLPSSLERALPLSGRGDVFDTLLGPLDHVFAGDRGAVIITGEPGIGKTRVAAELAAIAHQRGAIVLHGRFDPGHVSPLAAIGEALGQAGVAWPPPRFASGGDAAGRRELFAAVSSALDQLAERAPVVVVLDDVHWADRTGAALVEHVLTSPGGRRLLIVATARADVDNPATEHITGVAGVDQVLLLPLDEPGTGELAGSWSGHLLRPDLLAWLHEESGGNPLFVQAILHELARSEAFDLGEGFRGSTPQPGSGFSTINDLVASGCERLGAGGTEVLAQAAVLGMEFRSALLVEACGRPAAVVHGILDRAVQGRLIGQSLLDPRRFHFVHRLVRDAVLADVTDEELRALHRQAAAALAGEDAVDPSELAFHLLGTGDPDDELRAAACAAEAVRALAQQGLADEAVTLGERFLAGLSDPGDDRRGSKERVELLVACGLAELSRNAVTEARAYLLAAGTSALIHGEVEPLAALMPGLRASAQLDLDETMTAMVRSLLERVEATDRVRGVLLCWLSYELCRADPVAAARAAEEAIDLARAIVDAELLFCSLHTWNLTSAGLTSPVDRRAAAEEALRLDRRMAAPHQRAMSSVYLASIHLELGDSVAARQAIEQAKNEAGPNAPLALRWLISRTVAMVAIATGQWAEADGAAADIAEQVAVLGGFEAQAQSFAQQGASAFIRGGIADFESAFALLEAAGVGGSLMLASRALFESELRSENAAASTAAAASYILQVPPMLSYWPALGFVAQAVAAVGDESAPEVMARLRLRSGFHIVTTAVSYGGAVDRLLGLLAASCDDLDSAVALLGSSLEQHRTGGFVPFVARNAAELALVLERRGDPRDRTVIEDLKAEAEALAASYGLIPVRSLLADEPPP